MPLKLSIVRTIELADSFYQLYSTISWPNKQFDLFSLQSNEFQITCNSLTASDQELHWITRNIPNIPFVRNINRITWKGATANYIFKNIDWEKLP